MDKRSSLLNEWASSAVNWLGNKKKISLKPLIENYFKESSDKETSCDASVWAYVKFGRQNDQCPKVSQG